MVYSLESEWARSRSEAKLTGDACSNRVMWIVMVINILILLHYLFFISFTLDLMF